MRALLAEIKTRPIRLLSKVDAATYCGMSARRFPSECPVDSVTLSNGDQLYDIRDLDSWIDSMKAGARHDSMEQALERLR